ncbi:MAG: hypothetical protein GY862_20910, partial [Gammaproteobacteria bacterium]|nr:hypothetical protein [Gammaproteobacteria bacterium]
MSGKSRQCIGWFAALLFIVCGLSAWSLAYAGSEDVNAAIDRGAVWLAGKKNSEGYYDGGTGPATSFQATAEALYTLLELDGSGRFQPPGKDIQSALAFLNEKLMPAFPLPPQSAKYPQQTAEYISRALIVHSLVKHSVSDLRGALIARGNNNNGVSDLPGYEGTARDTAFALAAAALDKNAVETEQTVFSWIDYLLSKQQGGGWTDGRNKASVYVTAVAMRALWHYRDKFPPGYFSDELDIGSSLENAAAFLLAKHDDNGLWTETFESALALIAIIPTLTELDETILASIDALREIQNKDNGSWDDDVYTTALALRALYAADMLNFGNITGAVTYIIIDAETYDQTELPLSGISIELAGAETRTLMTDDSGSFDFKNLTAGSYTLTLLGAVQEEVEVKPGETVTLPLPFQDGIPLVYGQVTDATGSPLEDVQILVTDIAEVVYIAYTNGDGDYLVNNVRLGNVTVQAKKSGYVTTDIKDLSLVEGEGLEALLILLNANDPVSATVKGIARDAATFEILKGVDIKVQFEDPGQTLSTVSGEKGSFELAGLTLEGKISFTQEGYMPFSQWLFPGSGGILDLKDVHMHKKEIDLAVENIDVANATSDEETLALSGTVAVTVSNRGAITAAGEIMLLAFYDADLNGVYDIGSDLMLGQSRIKNALATKERAVVDISVAGQLPFRDAPVAVWADGVEAQVETNKKNNTGTSMCKAVQNIDLSTPKPEFEAELNWKWPNEGVTPELKDYNKVLSTPIVARLTDTNGDGNVNQFDTPAVIFQTFKSAYDSDGVLRAVSGKDGTTLWTAKQEGSRTVPSVSLAVANIDTDDLIEIIAPKSGGGLLVFEHTGILKPNWTNSDTDAVDLGRGGIAIADINTDGTPEIIAGNTILNGDGTLVWQGSDSITSNFPVVADIDLDKISEVIAGAYIYSFTKDSENELLFNQKTVLVSNPGNGLSAIGNFDNDDTPEIVTVLREGNKLILFDRQEGDWKAVWTKSPNDLNGVHFNGAPVVADMNGDGMPEIGVLAASHYMVLDRKGKELWRAKINENHDGYTGSSAFDFDGDGQSEVVYADQGHLRIYRGRDGTVLFEIKNSSLTANDLPIVADVDNDNHADIIVGSNPYNSIDMQGLRVYKDKNNNWANTRKIWNQHSYHITNINDDGSIPQFEEPSWLTHNTYRSNAFPDKRDLLEISDLTAGYLRITDNGMEKKSFNLKVRIGNAGAAHSLAGISVNFYAGNPDGGVSLLGVAMLDAFDSLAPGTHKDVDVDVSIEDIFNAQDIYAKVDIENILSECNENNNSTRLSVSASLPYGVINNISTAPSEPDDIEPSDPPAYGANTGVDIKYTVRNDGNLPFPADLSVVLSVKNADGETNSVFSQAITELASGATSELFSTNWNTGATLSGNYRAHAALYTRNGELVTKASTPFDVAVEIIDAFSLHTTTDKPEYYTTEEAHITHLIKNLTVNSVEEIKLSWHIQQSDDVQICSEEITITGLPPGGIKELAVSCPLVTEDQSAVPAGDYKVMARLARSENGEVIKPAVDQEFTVKEFYQTFTGQVTLEKSDDSWVCDGSFENIGNRVVPEAEWQLLLRKPEACVSTADTVVVVQNISMNTPNETEKIEISSPSAGDYSCILRIRTPSSETPSSETSWSEWQVLDSKHVSIGSCALSEVGLLSLDSGAELAYTAAPDKPAAQCIIPLDPLVALQIIIPDPPVALQTDTDDEKAKFYSTDIIDITYVLQNQSLNTVIEDVQLSWRIDKKIGEEIGYSEEIDSGVRQAAQVSASENRSVWVPYMLNEAAAGDYRL